MNDFYEKWKSDNKYRAKIKLLAYIIFVVIAVIYALSTNSRTTSNSSSYEYNQPDNLNKISNNIKIPESYTYKITVNIDDKEYTYNGKKTKEEETITREFDGIVTNYRYTNGEYYVLTDGIYHLTTQDIVYDNVKYDYINLTNINKYLSKAKKNNNEYFVYIKDIILGNESEDYFLIILNDNHINIDYTPLIKEFNQDIKKYLVDIAIENN